LKSKIAFIILLVIIAGLLVTYYFLGTGLMKQRHNNEALASQLTEKTDELAAALKPSQDLDARLAEAEENLADAISSIPTDLNSTMVINDILKLAEVCKVNAIPLTAGPWSEGSISQGYHVFNITMSLKGDLTQVHTFIDQLENVEFKTFIVENLVVEREAKTSTQVQASLNLSIYSRYTPTTKEIS
jgi:Tfp pilus assembly protein PilO